MGSKCCKENDAKKYLMSEVNSNTNEEEKEDILRSKELLVCLDIGTHASGYAYNLKDSRDIKTQDKIKTCLLIQNLDQAKSYLKYPDQFIKLEDHHAQRILILENARDIYDQLLAEPNSEPNNLYYFEYFKMNLYEKEGNERVMIKTLTKAKELPAEDVFGFVMLCLKRAVIKNLKSHGCPDTDCDQIHWIITVPAIWTDKSKQIMRKAAEKAQLYPKDGKKIHLRLALEPEAAALSCLFKPENANGILNRNNIQYLIIDGGGGTIDITAHKVINKYTKQVKEILRPCGLDKGSYYINKQFENFLHTIFGDQLCKEIKKNSKKRAGWNSLMETFERSKLVYSGSGIFTLGPIPLSIIDSFGSQKDFFDPFSRIGIKYSAGMLVFPESIAMKSIFEPVIFPIVNEVKKLLEKVELKDISCVLLVGGFAQCQLLQNSLKKSLRNIKLVTPVYPERAIVEGGCLFAKCQKLISSRKSRYTYGLDVASSDIQKYKDERHTIQEDEFGIKAIYNVFQIVVNCGDDVGESEKKTVSLARGSRDTTASFSILATLKRDVKYSDDDDVRVLGTLHLSGIPSGTNMSTNDANANWFKVEFHFGSTEIFVTATCMQSESSYTPEISLDFDTF